MSVLQVSSADLSDEHRGVSVRGALRKALADFYEHSWRLVLMNSAFSAVALAAAVAFAYVVPLALVLVLLLGPLAAALMHCAVTVVETEDVRVADFVAGIRLHWGRGLGLGLIAGAFVLATVVAFSFYSASGALAWPLAILVLYLAGMFGIFQLALWPLAVFERGRPLRMVVRDAAAVAARRPGAIVGLAAALFVINLLGVVAAVLPFLTMTIAYSFLAAARFCLPRGATREA
jgi:hypothetical protein